MTSSTTSFILGTIITYLFLMPSNPNIQEKTFYYNNCFNIFSEFSTNIYDCPSDKISMISEDIKIILDKQKVIYLKEPDRLADFKCSVYDINNWKCTRIRNKQTDVEKMSNGELQYWHDTPTKNKKGEVSHLPRRSSLYWIGMVIGKIRKISL